jgi:uncharacterized membrane-anchored protein
MNRNLRLGIFAVVAIAQLAVPAQMILSRETTLHEGALYKFRTQPVDPYDPFRGRYVTLSVQINQGPLPEGPRPDSGDTIYATLGTDEDGFATIESTSLTPPDSGDYIRAAAGWVDEGQGLLFVDLPIDRYYMNEWDAPAAEQAYREHSRMDQQDVYVTVRVFKGEVVIEGLFIADTPIEEFIKTMATTEGGNP